MSAVSSGPRNSVRLPLRPAAHDRFNGARTASRDYLLQNKPLKYATSSQPQCSRESCAPAWIAILVLT